MACQVALYANVFASPVETDTVPYDDQEYIQSSSLECVSLWLSAATIGVTFEDLLSLKHKLCRHGSQFIIDRDTGCCVSLDPLQIEGIIQTIAERIERLVMQNSHREKMTFVTSCDVILPRYGQPWQREATTGFVDFSGFGFVPTTEVHVDLIEKRKRDEGFDDDNLRLEMGFEQFVNGCKRSRAC